MMIVLRVLLCLGLIAALGGCRMFEAVLGPADGVIETRQLPSSGSAAGQVEQPEQVLAPVLSPPSSMPVPSVELDLVSAPVVVDEPDSSRSAESSPFQFRGAKPRRISMPVPIFPEGVVFDPMIPGWVEFEISINGDGTVADASVMASSHDELVEPATEAVLQARYTPVLDPNGYPLLVRFSERVEF